MRLPTAADMNAFLILEIIAPADSISAAAKEVNGDFGTSPLLGQFACTWHSERKAQGAAEEICENEQLARRCLSTIAHSEPWRQSGDELF
jgi:hypothetical protein